MSDFAYAHLNHVLCVLILVSRIGDIGTTYLVTPTLALEANPIMRRLGWRFALLTLAICFVPYLSLGAGVMILVPSLMVSASNASRIWVARTMGEREYKAFLERVAAASKLRHALAGLLVSAAFVILVGSVLVLLYPDSAEDYAFWFGAGIIAYGLVIAIHGSLSLIRLFKQVRTTGGVR
jgi:hypothetical protein